MSMWRRFATIALAIGLGLGPGLAAADPVDVAVKGDESPEPGFFYKDFRFLDVSNGPDPVLVFLGKASRTAPKQHRSCIWKVDAAGSGVDLACVKDLSPTGLVYHSFVDVSVNGPGAASWIAVLGESEARGVFHEGGTGVVTGDPIDQVDPANGTFLDLSFLTRLDAGGFVFRADIAGVPSSVNQGIFGCSGGDLNCSPAGSGSLSEVVRKGAAVDSGRILCSIAEVAGSNFGAVFRAGTKVDCADPLESTRTGIFRTSGGVPTTIALEGDPANPEGVYDEFLAGPDINNAGSVAFVAATRFMGEEAGARIYLCSILAGCPPSAAAVAVPTHAPVPGGTVNRFAAIGITDGDAIVFIGNGKKVGGVYVAGVGITPLVEVGESVPGDTAAFKSFKSLAVSSDGTTATQAAFKRTIKPRTKKEGIFLLLP
jgi:hypothetical protein